MTVAKSRRKNNVVLLPGRPKRKNPKPAENSQGAAFTKVPNVFIDEIMPNITGNATALALAIIRKTFGFQKIKDRLSTSQLMRITGQSKSTVCRGWNELERQGVAKRIGTSGLINIVENTLPTPGAQLRRVPGVTLTQAPAPKVAHTKDYKQEKQDPKKPRINRINKSTRLRASGLPRTEFESRTDRLPQGVGDDSTPPRHPRHPPGTPEAACQRLHEKEEVARLRKGLFEIMKPVQDTPPDSSLCTWVIEASGGMPAEEIVRYFKGFCRGKFRPTRTPTKENPGPKGYAWFVTLAADKLAPGKPADRRNKIVQSRRVAVS
jgi:phage replication O-like protein O